jgi:alpha-glucosidase
VPGAEVGEWVCIARRKGTDWYVGTINNSKPRSVTIPLDFLPAGNYHAEIYKDVPDAVNHPNQLIKETKEVSATDKLILNLPDGGGEVMRITKD